MGQSTVNQTSAVILITRINAEEDKTWQKHVDLLANSEAFGHTQQNNMHDTHPTPSVASELKMRGVSFRISIL